MKSLVIADIHQKIHLVDSILSKEKDFDEAIFLGDWFDSHLDPPHVSSFEETCKFLRGLILDHPKRKKFIFLLGNHDISYIYHNSASYTKSIKNIENYYCSGFTKAKAKKFRRHFYDKGLRDQFFFENFRPAYQSQGFTFSHAGIAPIHIPEGESLKGLVENILPHTWKNFRDLHAPHNWLLSGAGAARGGEHPIGGLLWLDWNMEFYTDNHLGKQVFGHTITREPSCRHMGTEIETWNIDTERDYGVILDGRLVTREIPNLNKDTPKKTLSKEELLLLEEFFC